MEFKTWLYVVCFLIEWLYIIGLNLILLKWEKQKVWSDHKCTVQILLLKVSLTSHKMGVKCHQNLWKLIKSCVLRVIICFHSFSALTINQTFVKRKERENPKYSTPRFEYFHSLKQIEGFPFRLSNTFPDIFTAPLTVQ